MAATINILQEKLKDYQEHSKLLKSAIKNLEKAFVRLSRLKENEETIEDLMDLDTVVVKLFEYKRTLASNNSFEKQLILDMDNQNVAKEANVKEMNEKFIDVVAKAREFIESKKIENDQHIKLAEAIIKNYEKGNRVTQEFNVLSNMIKSYQSTTPLTKA